MKIRVKTLKRILKEVALSPAVFKQEPVQDLMDRPNIAKALASLEQPLMNAMKQNLILAARDQYNEETREFDDQAWERVQTVAQKATEMAMAGCHKAVQNAWAQAMKGVGEEKPAAPAPAPKKAVA